MTTTVSVKLENVPGAIKYLLTRTANQIIRPAVKAGAEMCAREYRRLLAEVATKPGNTGVQAFTAVGVKSRAFKDDMGAYAIFGAKIAGGQMLAPQMRFGEKGTVKRQTAAGKNRGVMPAQRWLQLSLASSMQEARNVIIARIRSRVGGRT